MIDIRPAEPRDRAAIVEILHHGWHDGHADLVPPEVLPLRTPECIDDLYAASDDAYFVAEADNRVVGFVAINGDEVTKLFVARDARGGEVADKLLSFGERRVAGNGFAIAKLLCLVGNSRAERFYEKRGWVEDHRGPDELWMPPGAVGRFTAETMVLLKKVAESN